MQYRVTNLSSKAFQRRSYKVVTILKVDALWILESLIIIYGSQ